VRFETAAQFLLPFLRPVRRKAAPSTERLLVSSADDAIEVAVVRHPRARNYNLRIKESSRQAVLTMPRRGSLREARAFAERNAAWIAARLSRLPAAVPFAAGFSIPFHGVPHAIEHRPKARGTVWTEERDGQAILCVTGPPEHLRRRIADFLKREARRQLVEASRRYAAMLDVKIGRIGVRDTGSRWGSCSFEGSLSFSWRLVLAPPYVLDYLAAHEVAHRVELNHSRRFWRVVERLVPEWRRAEAWLKAHGNGLHRFGAC
jgi:predicted metal-dependent hydrolase